MTTQLNHWVYKNPAKESIGTCDRCGKKFLLKHLKEEWSGLTVCDSPHSRCFELKHESYSFQVRPDSSLAHSNPKFPRNEGEVDPAFDVEASLRKTKPWGE